MIGIAEAVPAACSQEMLWRGYYADRCGDDPRTRRLWHNAGVRTRHLAADPLVDEIADWGTGARMERFFLEAVPLAKQAIGNALAAAHLEPGDIGMLAVVSCTGYRNPGLDVRLAGDLGMPADLRRLAIGHLGCYAAIPGLATVTDYVTAHGRPAMLLCAELTSLHLQPLPHDTDQVVAHALFADACAAAVLAPDGRPHNLCETDVSHWAVHPGGPRIIDVVQQQLGLTDDQVAPSRNVLRDYGNCSSATVLLVLDRLRPAAGDYVVALAFGPGLTVAAALLKAMDLEQ